MISVSDILKILDQIPIWKAVTGLPRRVAELERKMGELQEQVATGAKTKVVPGRECPICGSPMKVLTESAHPTFGFSGMKIHNMECPDCGNKTTRTFEPGKGYR